jgi:hypothetical protein
MHYSSTTFGKKLNIFQRDLLSTYPKHVELFTKWSWEIMHFIGFVIRIYTMHGGDHTIVKTPTHTHTHTLQNKLKQPQYKLKQPQYKMHTPNEAVTI